MSPILCFEYDCAVVPPGRIAEDQALSRETREPVSLVSTDDKEWHFREVKEYTLRMEADI